MICIFLWLCCFNPNSRDETELNNTETEEVHLPNVWLEVAGDLLDVGKEEGDDQGEHGDGVGEAVGGQGEPGHGQEDVGELVAEGHGDAGPG